MWISTFEANISRELPPIVVIYIGHKMISSISKK